MAADEAFDKLQHTSDDHSNDDRKRSASSSPARRLSPSQQTDKTGSGVCVIGECPNNNKYNNKKQASTSPSSSLSNSSTRPTTTTTARNFPPYRYPGTPPRTANWKNVLKEYLHCGDKSAEENGKQILIYYSGEDYCVVIYDGYPKARMHLLLVPIFTAPTNFVVNSIADLRKEAHLATLQKCHILARIIVQHLTQEYKTLYHGTCSNNINEGDEDDEIFKLGYHSVPSLNHLHLHIISKDLDSPYLKRKEHYNSFTTSFFTSAHLVEQQLLTMGRISVSEQDESIIKKQTLVCWKCGYAPKHLPDWKKHNLSVHYPPGGHHG